ncbi:peptidase E [Lysinibacillus sp. 54212]|uniref:Type 1 glutamine amidotransferase-like domain-containing protein n=1 Tax=Lysinibacillus sp. 54212 TaxID=3119829 RepID=UPI002FC728C7
MRRQILAISGGGFSKEIPSEIDSYLILQIQKEKIKICFIPTASNDAQGYIDNFYKAFPNCEASHILQNNLQEAATMEHVLSQDILYVGGGNTKSMLAKWREAGFHDVLLEAYEKGVLLAGISAGAMCWFEKCFSENEQDEYEAFDGLGILKGTFCPHYDDKNRRAAFASWIAQRPDLQAYTLTDEEYLHFENEGLKAHLITK